MQEYILAIDQGTTSSRAILFDQSYKIVASSQREFPQYFPQPGWVEHDPEEIWNSVFWVCHDVIKRAKVASKDISAIGITNQRETTIVWSKDTGEPIHNAIVWQDRRTTKLCNDLKARGVEKEIQKKTGLLLDPYFSATKLSWILDNVQGARARANSGELLFGTVDTFLLWRLTRGKYHLTDATNASRTMLFNLSTGSWDGSLANLFNVPKSMLPKIQDNSSFFGEADNSLFGASIPIGGMAGDQQAAAIGQACFSPGMVKSTYGTGCFVLLNTGSDRVVSKNKMITTLAYQLNGQKTYALEGSIFIAGAAVQWLRDSLTVIETADQTAQMAKAADPEQNVILVPAFTGLGAPYWAPEAQGAIFGLTRGSGPNELAKAALQAVGYQTRDLLEAMHADLYEVKQDETILRVDGGMSANDWCMQFLADILGVAIERSQIQETTALGAAYLAGFWKGLYSPPEIFAKQWKSNRRYLPNLNSGDREKQYLSWQNAVKRTLLSG